MSAFVFAIIYIFGSVLVAPITYALGVPGGNISDPVVRGVDIAKPAVVRIVTTIKGRLTVDFTVTNRVTFPLGGGTYKLQASGSGAFISAHGDILTADHVINPPQGAEIDQFLYQTAAQDVADYINNNLNQPTHWTAANVFAVLSNGSLNSQPQYDAPTSRVYLSTDFTGPTNSPSLNSLPPGTSADVDQIRKENDFQHGDTAIIHVPMDNMPSIKLDDSTNVAQQDELTIIGYPANGDLVTVTNNGNLIANPSNGYLTASVNKAYVSAIKQNGGTPLIQVGGNVEQGDSGGPALDSSGNIVGIVSFFRLSNGPEGTSFLQTSHSAQQLIDSLQLDTQPGKLQSAWSQAFTQYSSTQAGHWHLARQQLQQLLNDNPNFHALQPYLDYATAQANQEIATTTNSPLLIGIALLVLVIIAVLVLVLLLRRRKPGPQVAPATQPPSYQPYNYGARPSSESEQTSPSGGIAQIDFKDGVDQNASATPVALYNAASSGPLPTVPNQSPTNPWPQPIEYGSAAAHRQPAPYGQQPYNTAQPARPVQGATNPGYPLHPAQPPYPQQHYGSYPQVPATPWPPVPGNTPVPYAPQNPAQQDLRGQQPPTYGSPYGQPPQGYGAMPTPAQPRPVQPAQPSQQYSGWQPQQAFTPLSQDVPTTSDDSTARVSQRSTSAAQERVKPAEDKENPSSSMPALSKDQTEIASILSEQKAPKRFDD